MTTRCPICGAAVEPPATHRPFCSSRCRLVDLDRWLSGDYRIPGPTVPTDAGRTVTDDGGGAEIHQNEEA